MSTSVCVCVFVSVCVSICPRGYLRNHTRDLHQVCFVHVAYGRGSVLLRQCRNLKAIQNIIPALQAVFEAHTKFLASPVPNKRRASQTFTNKGGYGSLVMTQGCHHIDTLISLVCNLAFFIVLAIIQSATSQVTQLHVCLYVSTCRSRGGERFEWQLGLAGDVCDEVDDVIYDGASVAAINTRT